VDKRILRLDPTTPTSTPVVTKQPVKADDPANIFCKSQGHDLIIRFDQETQSSKSFCRFSDLTECTANDFYTGDCHQERAPCQNKQDQKKI